MGAVFRCNPDGTQMELFASGLRNPQSLVFNEFGDLLTGDNDCDNGDEERLVHVVEGGDSGWRVGYQHAPMGKGNPWLREGLWKPAFPGRPAYLLPPICNIEDGPSGLTYYPGTGLTPEYAGHFFITHFKGSIARSGIQTYTLKQNGATFAPTSSQQFMGGVLPTDVTFGPDGVLYLSDWVDGWPKSNKGRIYGITPANESAAQKQARADLAALLAGGFTGKSDAELAALLSHVDRRARLEAQLELASRGDNSVAVFSKVLADRKATPLARLHAVWGLTQLGKKNPKVGPLLVKLARDERDPLDLDLPERKILLKPDGSVDRVVVPQRLDAHRLIEEFMILANVAAAEMLEKKALPLIYRVHDEPSQEKVHNLQEFLKTLDLPFAKSGALRPSLFNRVLGQVRGEDYEPLVNEVVLRSQAQAEYSAENYGHFGLNLRRYAHFTSPIRRYADLIVHRALIRALGLGEGALPETETLETLSEVAAQISVTERRAMKAERETADRLIAHFLADRIGATFQGRISGVTRAGLFVKLSDTGADGLIPIRTLGTEYYNYDETRHALVGSRSGAMHRLGDVVDVRLVEAAPVAGALRFELLSEGQVIPRGRKRDGAKASTTASKSRPGRSPREKIRKPSKGKSGKAKPGKSKKGTSWKR